MITFKLFWESFNTKQNLFYSWISPVGKIHPVQKPLCHYDVKYNIIKKENLKPRLNGEYDDMFDLGYCRLLIHNNIVYIQNDLRPPTQKQLKVIKDLCIEYGVDEFRLDLGGRESRLLWSRGD